MKRDRWIRQAHRWLSIVFTLFVVANIGLNATGVGGEAVATTVGVSTLVPLFLLLLSGLYLFVLPYAPRGRGPGAEDVS